MSAPWFKDLADGTVVPLAFLKIDLEDSTKLGQRLSRDEQRSARDAYRRAVEGAMQGIDALPQPPHWAGDGASFIVGGPRAPQLAVEAAIQLLRDIRMVAEIELHARIAIGFDDVPFRAQVGTIDCNEFNFAGHLEAVCPRDSVLITEEAYLALKDEPGLATKFEYFGMRADDRCPAFVAPKGRERREAKKAESLVPLAEDPYAVRDSLLRCYDDPLFRQVRFIGVRQLERLGGVDLLSVFQPLRLRQWRGGARNLGWLSHFEGEGAAKRPRSGKREVEDDAQLPASRFDHGPVDFAATFARVPQLVILGDPGAGKSTLLRYAALAAAGGRRSFKTRLQIEGRLLPLYASVGRLAPLIGEGRAKSPVSVLADYYRGLGVRDSEQVIQDALDSNTALLLFDGLDEAASVPERRDAERFIEAILSRHPRCRALVTSRIVGFTPLSIMGGETWVLDPLEEAGAASLARAFYTAYYRKDYAGDDDRARAQAGRETDSLIQSLSTRPGLQHFRENPLLLTLAALVHTQMGRLPRYRARLYHVATQTLIEAWASARLAVPALQPVVPIDYEAEGLAVFPALGLELHLKYGGGLISEKELLAFIASRLPAVKKANKDEASKAARELLRRVTLSGSILIERGQGTWGFLHQSLEEYLAAKALAMDDDLLARVFGDHLYDPRFEEVWRLVAGEMGVVQERPPAAAQFVRAVFEDKDQLHAEIFRKNVLLAAKCLADTAVNDADLVSEIITAVADVVTSNVPPIPDDVRELLVSDLAAVSEGQLLGQELLVRLRAATLPVRANIAHFLGTLEFGGAVEDLMALVRSDGDNRLRAVSAAALGRIGDERAAAVLHERLQCETDFFVKLTIIGTLGELGSRESLPLLLPLLSSRITAAELEVASQALWKLGAREEILKVLIDVGDGARTEARRWITVALRDLGARESVPALLHVIRADPSAEGRRAAASALGQIRALEAVPDLLVLAAKDPVEDVRVASLGALAQMNVEEVLPLLLARIGAGSDGQTQGEVMSALARFSDSRVHEAFASMAERGEPFYIRCDAARALGMTRATQHVPLLMSLLEHDPVQLVRVAAAQALGRLGVRAAVPLILEALKRETVDVWRHDLLASLAQLGERKALEPALQNQRTLAGKSVAVRADGLVFAWLDNFNRVAWKLSLLPPYRTRKNSPPRRTKSTPSAPKRAAKKR